ncbi:MAG: aminotransferase class V-fold PLP-dependent enzyme [Hyphomicrobiales bacterium]
MTAFGRALLPEWGLDPEIAYLNHGTVGAAPLRVLRAAERIRLEVERQPARFLLRELAAIRVGGPRATPPRLRTAAAQVGAFLGAAGDHVAFVDNATTGVNAVLRSLPLQEGDEIVRLDHGYGSVGLIAGYVARERGAAVRTVTVPFPEIAPDALLDALDRALGPRTRIAVLDHVTSESALVLPIAAMTARCRARGVPVLVDGAHAPGAIALDIPSIGADWYAANLHKWAWSPRSCGILWAAPERQAGLHPAVISWGLDQGFTTEFDWVGTRDPAPFLAAPEGIEAMRAIGVEAVRRHNHDLAWSAAKLLAERWETRFTTPEPAIGCMATLALPERAGHTAEDAARLRDRLLERDRIEVQLHAWGGRLWVRISAQVYNETADYERLAEAVLARSGA